MQGTISPDVARAAVAFRRNHPQVPALDILDVCMRQRTGSVGDFGEAADPGGEFAALVCEACRSAGQQRLDWGAEVLPWFADRYGLSMPDE